MVKEKFKERVERIKQKWSVKIAEIKQMINWQYAMFTPYTGWYYTVFCTTDYGRLLSADIHQNICFFVQKDHNELLGKLVETMGIVGPYVYNPETMERLYNSCFKIMPVVKEQ